MQVLGDKTSSDDDFSPSESETYIPDDTDRFVACDGSAGCPVYDVSETGGSEAEFVLSPCFVG